jgi:hypothetical protein
MERFREQTCSFVKNDAKKGYSGKINKLAADDLMISFILSIYFSRSQNFLWKSHPESWRQIQQG